MCTIEEKEIYADLGILSTRFANIEHIIHELMVKIIVRDSSDLDELFGVTPIENQPLSKRLSLLEKLNRFNNFYSDRVLEVIELIKPKMSVRNYFIHGIWTIGKKNIQIENKKIKFTQRSDGRTWRYGGAKHILPEDLKNLNKELLAIIEKGQSILDDIENYGFERS